MIVRPSRFISRQQPGEAVLLLVVEPARRLVEQDDGRIGHQDRGERGALLLAAAEIARVAAAQPLQPQPRQQRQVALRIGRHAMAAPREGQLIGQRLLEEQRAGMLRHVAHGADHVIERGAARIQARNDNLTLVGFEQADDLLEQRAFPGAVAPHQRHELARRRLEADPAQRRVPVIGILDALRRNHRRICNLLICRFAVSPTLPLSHSLIRRLTDASRQPPRKHPPLFDRQRQRLPIELAAQLDQRWDQRQRGHDHPRLVEDGRLAQRGHVDHAVGILHDALQPVLAEHDRQAQVFVQMAQRHQHLFGGLRVELRGRLVEHQDLRLQRQHRGDRHPLLLAAGEGADAPVAQVGDRHLVQHLFDALAHRRRRQSEVLHGKRQLILHGIDDELRFGILEDEADEIGHAARGQRHRVAAEDIGAAGPAPAVEVGHESIEAAQEGGFPRTGWPDHQHKLAGPDRRREVGQRRRGLVGVGVGDVGQLDQDIWLPNRSFQTILSPPALPPK